MLMNPSSFDWVKNFMSSDVVQLLGQSTDTASRGSSLPNCFSPMEKLELTHIEKTLMEVVVPETPPKAAPPSEPTSVTSPPVNVSPSTGPWSKELLEQAHKLKEKESASRRSLRMQNQKKGFRKSACLDKNCIGCSFKPPVLTSSVIKNLGEAFCKVDASKLTDACLKKKKKLPPPGGKKPAVKKLAPNDHNKDKQAKKKSKQ